MNHSTGNAALRASHHARCFCPIRFKQLKTFCGEDRGFFHVFSKINLNVNTAYLRSYFGSNFL